MKLEFNQPNCLDKLAEELSMADLTPKAVLGKDDYIQLIFDDIYKVDEDGKYILDEQGNKVIDDVAMAAIMQKVQAVLAAHDPTPRPLPKSDIQKLQDAANNLGEQLFNAQTDVIVAREERDNMGAQLFDTQTQLIESQQINNDLGSQLFDLQTQLIMKEVI